MSRRTIALLPWTVLLSICLAGGVPGAVAQDGDAVPLADLVRQSAAQTPGHRARHVITNDDLPSHTEQPSTDPEVGVAKPNAEQPETSAPGKKERPATPEASQTEKSIEDLREQKTFLIEQIASLKEQIAVGPVDSRHDVLAHLLEYRCARLETVRHQLDELEQRARSSSTKRAEKEGEKPAAAETPRTGASPVAAADTSTHSSTQ
jgi:hypothetical protein